MAISDERLRDLIMRFTESFATGFDKIPEDRMNLEIEAELEKKIAVLASLEDPAHDLLHFKRVVKLAKDICHKEGGKPEVVIPAAWLHDFVIVPKNDPRRSQASRLSAEAAIEYLRQLSYPEVFLDEIGHAIAAHSFSARIETKTLEAQIVQDADRLDGLGATGIARCFATAGLMKRAFYADLDPFCQERKPDDGQYTIDHFFVKLFKTAQTLNTPSAREEGTRRVEVMKRYLADFEKEIV